MDYKKVEGHADLVRDLHTGAIINNDKLAYQNYVHMKNEKLRERERLNNMEKELDNIKIILNKILDKL